MGHGRNIDEYLPLDAPVNTMTISLETAIVEN